MPFLPEQMSPESLRRLAKAQRRALSSVLGVEATQAQAQEVLARTFGFEHWHELNERLKHRQPPAPATLMHMGDHHLARDVSLGQVIEAVRAGHSPSPDHPSETLVVLGDIIDRHPLSDDEVRHQREAIQGGLQDVAIEQRAENFASLMRGDVMETSSPASAASVRHLAGPDSRTERAQHLPRSFSAPEGLLRYHWPEFKDRRLEDVHVDLIRGVLSWITQVPIRLAQIAPEDRQALLQRVRGDSQFALFRDQMLEAAWARLAWKEPQAFVCAVPFIPADQIWPWLHRAASQSRRDMMEAIHHVHERAIGSEPFYALANAVFQRDSTRITQLIEAQSRRYGLAINDRGGQQRGGVLSDKTSHGATSPRRHR